MLHECLMRSHWTSDMIILAMKSIVSDMFFIIVRGLAGSSRMRQGMQGDWTQCWWQRCELCIHGVFMQREGEEQSGGKKGEKKSWIAITKRCLQSFIVPISPPDRKISAVKWFGTSRFSNLVSFRNQSRYIDVSMSQGFFCCLSAYVYVSYAAFLLECACLPSASGHCDTADMWCMQSSAHL